MGPKAIRKHFQLTAGPKSGRHPVTNMLKVAAISFAVSLAGCSGETTVKEDDANTDHNPLVQSASAKKLRPYKDRPITDDIIYFLLPDRFANGDATNDTGGYEGGALDHGFDPTHKGFYHGGDLKGLIGKLDYLEGMGVTAIWMAPIFKNKPVQGAEPWISAGYHGYWITDFTQIDPHFGSNDDLKALVEEAHSRDIKVIFDIITNHTADVVRNVECHGNEDGSIKGAVSPCLYRNKTDFPYTTLGDKDGRPINNGFMGDGPEGQTAENFAKLVQQNYAYTPYVPEAEKTVKVPAWLNDLKYYHNRGESAWAGESSLYGDFAGLDDLFTEHPDVVNGFIDIYKNWISEFKIDGFRIDTVRHVNDEFWQKLSPALIAHAKAENIPNFYIFGEVYDPSPKNLSHFITAAKLPAVLDFGFQSAAYQLLAENKGTAVLSTIFAQDGLYTGGNGSALELPTFLDNHDMGRLAMMIKREMPTISDEELLDRLKLGHALMFFTRGVPVIYSGGEQGFVGDGNDQDAREDMFPSKVAIYNDNDLVGTTKTTADDNFDTSHPLYLEIARLSNIYRAHPALRGGQQSELISSEEPGLYAFVRSDAEASFLVLLNSDTNALGIDPASIPSGNWARIDGGDQSIGGTIEPTLAGLSFAIYKQK